MVTGCSTPPHVQEEPEEYITDVLPVRRVVIGTSAGAVHRWLSAPLRALRLYDACWSPCRTCRGCESVLSRSL
jgi:hypothetical protein